MSDGGLPALYATVDDAMQTDRPTGAAGIQEAEYKAAAAAAAAVQPADDAHASADNMQTEPETNRPGSSAANSATAEEAGGPSGSSKNNKSKDLMGELLKLGTVMDFGQDFHGARGRERKKPQEILEKEGEKEEKEKEKKDKAEREEKRKRREIEKAEREAQEEIDRQKNAEEEAAREAAAAIRAEKRKQAAERKAAKEAAGGGPSESGGKKKENEEEKDEPKKETRRETEEQKLQVMQRLEPLQQLLMLGLVPEEADLSQWSDFGSLMNGHLEIKQSQVRKVIGSYELGRGLFACKDFLKDEVITVYGGELITSDEAKHRKDNRESQSRRYLMRISDSDFLVDGWMYAAGITEVPNEDGNFVPKDGDAATQWMQGCGPMANHDSANHNAYLSFIPLGRGAEYIKLLPRIPTLRAHRTIRAGEEILFNYGSSLPFFSKPESASSEATEVTAAAVEGQLKSRPGSSAGQKGAGKKAKQHKSSTGAAGDDDGVDEETVVANLT